MSVSEPRLSRSDLARLGEEVYRREIGPILRTEDNGKFVAIDVESGSFEVDENEHSAVSRLHLRVPGAQVWLIRAGYPTAHRLRFSR